MAAEKLFSWGANSYGQLGHGHTNDISCPTLIPEACHSIQCIVGGGGHSLVVDRHGKVYTCGWNNKGQLGVNDLTNRHQFKPICDGKMSGIRLAVCGWNHTLTVTDDGKLFVFGCNTFGQLGLETDVCSYPSPTPCQFGRTVVHVAAGLWHSLAVIDDGTVWSWGKNKRGQLGIPGLTAKKITKPTQVSHLKERCIKVAAGSHHSAAITEDGQLYCWGSNQHGQCGIPVEKASMFEKPHLIGGILSNEKIVCILSGWSHLFAITANKDVFSWGRSDYGQLGLGDNIVKQRYSCQPINVPSLKTTKQIVCGAEHSIALLDNSDVLTWGWNEHGICGFPDEVNVHEPRHVKLPDGYQAVLVGCGGGHTFVVVKTK